VKVWVPEVPVTVLVSTWTPFNLKVSVPVAAEIALAVGESEETVTETVAEAPRTIELGVAVISMYVVC
jgi:hypothetical protein